MKHQKTRLQEKEIIAGRVMSDRPNVSSVHFQLGSIENKVMFQNQLYTIQSLAQSSLK